MQRGLGAIGPVEIAHGALDARVVSVVRGRPVDLGIVVPFLPLGDLASHEQQLLTRMRPHEPIIGAQIYALLPVVARDLADQRTLSLTTLFGHSRRNESGRAQCTAASHASSPCSICRKNQVPDPWRIASLPAKRWTPRQSSSRRGNALPRRH